MMRVSIDHNEKSVGLLFRSTKHEVVTSIQFTAEELAVINGRKLKEYVVLERGWDATMKDNAAKHPEYYDTVPQPNLTIGKLVKGPDHYVFDTPIESKRYEGQLTEALKQLKGFLVGNETRAESKSFEL
jgi:hypothetical protein